MTCLRSKQPGRGQHLRWFEHYDREDPTLDEVFITAKGKADGSLALGIRTLPKPGNN